MKKVLVVCTTDSMIWNFLIPHIEYLQSKGFSVECACSRTGFYYDELKDKGLELHEISFKRSPFKIQNIKAFFKLKRLISKNDYDLIQCHEPVGGAMGRLAGKACRKKVMYFAHGFHFFKGAPKTAIIYYIFEKTLSLLTDDLVTINNEDYNNALRFHAKRVHKIHGIGIDLSKFTQNHNPNYIKSELNLSLNTFCILSVGELIPRKNHITVIRALSHLPIDIHYIIAGEGESLKYLKSEAEKLNVSERVHFLGFRKDISSICNSVDLYVFPSYQEGLSVALMEAMSIGLPIVASNIRGNSDLIDSDRGGYLIKPDDVDGFSKAIQRVKDSDWIIRQFGDYNRSKIQNYDIKTVISEIDKIMNLS